jgi:hypothetical protein
MLTNKLLDDCRSRWHELNERDKDKLSFRAEGTKFDGYSAFMNDCITLKQIKH